MSAQDPHNPKPPNGVPSFPENEDWAPTGPTLDEGGQMHGISPAPHPAAASAAPPRGPPPLELSRPPRGERGPGEAAVPGVAGEPAFAPPPRPRRRTRFWVMLSLALSAATAWILLSRSPPHPARRGELQILRIESKPSGASVSIGGEAVGTTPFFQENLYPETDVEVRLTLKGYEPWIGHFRGNQPVTLNATLKRSKR